MNNTTNYNLKKPESTDFYDVEDQNDNMDIIDGALKSHDDALSTVGGLGLSVVDGKIAQTIIIS
jgi:hypothetical protein